MMVDWYCLAPVPAFSEAAVAFLSLKLRFWPDHLDVPFSPCVILCLRWKRWWVSYLLFCARSLRAPRDFSMGLGMREWYKCVKVYQASGKMLRLRENRVELRSLRKECCSLLPQKPPENIWLEKMTNTCPIPNNNTNALRIAKLRVD